jgi:hypothetical protein
MRTIYKGLGLVFLVVSLLAALAVAAQAQDAGTFEGQVVNGTSGGPEVGGGLPVTLHVYRGAVEEDTRETTTGADGSFRFEGLDTDPALEYWPEVAYSQVPYSNNGPFQFGTDQNHLTATVTVYETTGDDAAIRVDSIHFIAQSFGEMLRVTEVHLFGNSGDRTYVGGGEGGESGTLHIPLPENAVGLAFQDDAPEDRFLEIEGGVWDTEPVPPGSETSVAFFSYHLTVSGDAIALERSFAYPVASLTAMIAQPGLDLRSDQLQPMGLENFEDQEYRLFVGTGLMENTVLALELIPMPDLAGAEGMESAAVPGGHPATMETRGNQGLLRWFGFALAGLAVVGLVVYSVSSRRPHGAVASAPKLAANPETRRLLSELADLEDAYESGQVDEVTYERQRAATYEVLKSLVS